MEPESIIYNLIEEKSNDLGEVNLPPSNEYLHFNNYRLHIRTDWPNDPTSVKGVVLFIHGYLGHGSRPPIVYLSNELIKKNYLFVTIDLPGHGYSSGLRGYIPNINDHIQCCYNLIQILYKSDCCRDDNNYYINRKYQFHKKTPLVLVGQSMGGGIAILLANKLKSTPINNVQFVGTSLLCPLIEIFKEPPGPVKFLLKYFFAPLFSSHEIFAFLRGSASGKAPEDNIIYGKYVQYENQQGLGGCSEIRFGTAASMIHLSEQLKPILPTIDYPFIIMIDPQDLSVSYKAVQNMMNISSTNPNNKQLIDVPGAGHGLFMNCLGKLSKTIISWIEQQVQDGSDSNMKNTI